MLELDKIYNVDCLEGMKQIDDNSIDLTITSPPYNVGVDYGNGREKDKFAFSDYYNNIMLITKELCRILKSGGRFCLEIGGSGRNFPISWCWQDSAYKNNLKLYSEIVIPHRKTNPTAWGSWLKADNVYTIPSFHLAYVFYKDTPTKNNGNTTITPKQFTEWTRGVWRINYSGHKTKHPAEFPIELPERFLKLFGHENDIVLDPFIGSGTTAVACKMFNRQFIGF